MSKDFWGRRVKAPQIKKLNSYLTIPAFSFNCGFPKYSAEFDGSSVSYLEHRYPSVAMTLGRFTVSAWVYYALGGNETWTKVIFAVQDESTLDPTLSIMAYQGKIRVCLMQGGVLNTYDFSLQIPTFEWSHIAVVFSVVPGTGNLKCYINGIVDPTSYNTAQPLDLILDQFNYIGGTPQLPTTFSGRISNVVVYGYDIDEVYVTADTLMRAYRCPDTVSGVNGLDNYQLYQYRLNDNSATPVEFLSSETLEIKEVVSAAFSWAADSPVRFGSSFCCGEYAVTASVPCSIVYPVTAPSDADFGLVVRWVDDDGEIQRRILFTVDGVVFPSDWPDYNGEGLPSTFVLEVWGIDGEATANLAADLDIYLSILTDPAESYDLSNVEDNTPVESTLLAENFSLVFPLTFAVQQTY